jgi:hypothetical protein
VSFGRSRTIFKGEIVRLEQDDISSFAALQETSCQNPYSPKFARQPSSNVTARVKSRCGLGRFRWSSYSINRKDSPFDTHQSPIGFLRSSTVIRRTSISWSLLREPGLLSLLQILVVGFLLVRSPQETTPSLGEKNVSVRLEAPVQ